MDQVGNFGTQLCLTLECIATQLFVPSKNLLREINAAAHQT